MLKSAHILAEKGTKQVGRISSAERGEMSQCAVALVRLETLP